MKSTTNSLFIFSLQFSLCIGFRLLNLPSIFPSINRYRKSTPLIENVSSLIYGLRARLSLPLNILGAKSENAISAEEKNSLLISKAREIVGSNLGLSNANLLADDFLLTQVYRRPLSKAEYLNEFSSYNVTKAFPDLQFNAHDFRVDKYGNVVLTIRMQGTHRGILNFQNKAYEPTFKRIDLGPECVSLKFSASNKCTELTMGFHMDREIGNGGGVGGIWGMMAAIGYPVSVFDRIPPGKIVPNLLARSIKPKFQPSDKRMPIAEPIMTGLTRQIAQVQLGDCQEIASNLSRDFVYMEPYVGPLKKKGYLKLKSRTQLGRGLTNLVQEIYDLRLDPFDPARVWFTVQISGTFSKPALVNGEEILPTNASFTTPPEAGSVTFDRRGFVKKLTLGYPMGVEKCSTNGLVGTTGVLEGMGLSEGLFNTRPFPESVQIISDSMKKNVVDSFTLKIDEKALTQGIKAQEVKKALEESIAEKAKNPIEMISAPSLKPNKVDQISDAKAEAPEASKIEANKAAAKEKVGVANLFQFSQKSSKEETAKSYPSQIEKISESFKRKAPTLTPEKDSKASPSPIKIPNFFSQIAASTKPSESEPKAVETKERKSKVAMEAVASPVKASQQYSMSAALESKIDKVAGKSGLTFLQSRLSAYLKGAISVTDYVGSLRKYGCIDFLPEIAEDLPPGNQQKALSNFAKK